MALVISAPPQGAGHRAQSPQPGRLSGAAASVTSPGPGRARGLGCPGCSQPAQCLLSGVASPSADNCLEQRQMLGTAPQGHLPAPGRGSAWPSGGEGPRAPRGRPGGSAKAKRVCEAELGVGETNPQAQRGEGNGLGPGPGLQPLPSALLPGPRPGHTLRRPGRALSTGAEQAGGCPPQGSAHTGRPGPHSSAWDPLAPACARPSV